MNSKAKFYVEKLELIPHPEGGYFKEVYRSDEYINKVSLPERYSSNRGFSTSIYFLLEGEQVSTFHKLKSDEIWHFYDGSSVKIYIIDREGNLSEITVGNDLKKGEVLQAVIPKLSWFAAEVTSKKSFTLIGCTVAPGFEFEDFELADRDSLIHLFPDHSDLITRFTK